MKHILFPIFLLVTFFSCSNLESVEVKEGDIIIESYTRRKSDFAKHGTYTRYSTKGKILEKSEYENNELHGTQEFYYPNGQISELINYKKGVHDGEFKAYQVATYVAGAWEGELKVYYLNGKLKEVLQFERGKEMGPFKEYHKNGNLKTEGTYNGADPDTEFALEHNELKKYDENGEHYQTMNCNNGRCSTTWRKEGVEIIVE
jgi:antitoxin component YwqK of YwqJK toxin-antitoxin module